MININRLRTNPIDAHAYTLPVVREVPIGAAIPSTAPQPDAPAHPLVYAADAHAW